MKGAWEIWLALPKRKLVCPSRSLLRDWIMQLLLTTTKFGWLSVFVPIKVEVGSHVLGPDCKKGDSIILDHLTPSHLGISLYLCICNDENNTRVLEIC